MTQLVGRDQALEWLVWAGVLSWEEVESVDAQLDEVILDSIQFGDDDQEVQTPEDEIDAAIEDDDEDILDEAQFGGFGGPCCLFACDDEYTGPELEPIQIEESGGKFWFPLDDWFKFYGFTD